MAELGTRGRGERRAQLPPQSVPTSHRAGCAGGSSLCRDHVGLVCTEERPDIWGFGHMPGLSVSGGPVTGCAQPPAIGPVHSLLATRRMLWGRLSQGALGVFVGHRGFRTPFYTLRNYRRSQRTCVCVGSVYTFTALEIKSEKFFEMMPDLFHVSINNIFNEK